MGLSPIIPTINTWSKCFNNKSGTIDISTLLIANLEVEHYKKLKVKSMNIVKLVKTWWNDINEDSVEMNKSIDPRMYLILREDLAFKYIQGGHALAQYALEHPEFFKEWGNGYLICLSVFNGLALDEVKEKLEDEQFHISAFYEPDLKSELPTAIAVYEWGEGEVANALNKLSLATK